MSLLPRRTNKLIGVFGIAVLVAGGSLATTVDSALAATPPAKTVARCEGQTFSQPFTANKDANYYTLLPGSQFEGPTEGWELSNGAQILKTTEPNGGTGSVLDMPSGATAVSPLICVTLQYPTARAWVRNVRGAEGISIGVAYAHTATANLPKNVGQIHGAQSSWTLSNPINVQPQTAGPTEETREVRFVFTSGGKTSDFQLYGFYVDPRMN